MTISEACALAGVHWSTLSRWIKAGKVSAVKNFRGRLVVDEESLKAHLAKTSPVGVSNATP
jgi:excisionase family DNA binding protein